MVAIGYFSSHEAEIEPLVTDQLKPVCLSSVSDVISFNPGGAFLRAGASVARLWGVCAAPVHSLRPHVVFLGVALLLCVTVFSWFLVQDGMGSC